jgi:endonuclease/exonuclease/phosphatase (EEP) superfamily protein YafD
MRTISVAAEPSPGGIIAWSRHVLGLVAAAYLIVVAAGAGIALLGPAQAGISAFIRELLFFLVVPAPILLVPALLIRARAATAMLLVPFVACAVLYAPRLAPTASAAPAGPHLRVFTFNVGNARGLTQPDAVVRAIGAAQPDVVCLVEAPANTLTTVGDRLYDDYPYQVGSNSVFVLSRFPLMDVERVILRTGAHDSLEVTVEIDHRLVSLIGVHFLRTDT